MNMWLNILLALAAGVLAWFLTFYLDHRPAPVKSVSGMQALPWTGDAPEFSFTTLQGQSRNIRDFRGRIVLLNFWASWCAPCIEEFPNLLRIAQQNENDVTLIALSLDYNEAAVTGFLEKMRKEGHGADGENVFIGLDPMGQTGQELFQVFRLPETVIIGRDGWPASKLVGSGWTLQELQDFLGEMP